MGSELEERQEVKEFTQDDLTSERKDIELLDFMLSYLPKFCPVKEGVATAFNHLVPMTVKKFELVADKYKLPKPRFDDKDIVFDTVKDEIGTVAMG